MSRFISFVALAALVLVSWFVLPVDSQIVLSPAPAAAGATPGGSDTQVQFNDGGSALGGDAGLTYNKTTDSATLAGALNLTNGNLIGQDTKKIILGLGAVSPAVEPQDLRPVLATADGSGDIVGASLTIAGGGGEGSGGASGNLELAAGGFTGGTPASLILGGVYTAGANGVTMVGGTGSSVNADGGQITLRGGAGNGIGTAGGALIGGGNNQDAGFFGAQLYMDGASSSASGTSTFTGRVTIPGLIVSGTAPAVANVGANSCGTTAAAIAGNDNAGVITVGATSGTACRITFTAAAPNRWICDGNNESTAALVSATYVDTTHVDISGVFGGGAVISYQCLPR